MQYEEFIKAINEENIRHRKAMQRIDRNFFIGNAVIILVMIFAMIYPHVH